MKGQASQPRIKTQSEFRSQASSQNGMTNRSRSVSAHRKQANVFNQMYGKNKTPNKKPKILYQSTDTLQVQSNLTQRKQINSRRASDLKGDNHHTRNPSKGSGYLVTNTKSMLSNNSVMSKQKNLLNDFYGVRSKSRPRLEKDNDSQPINPGQRFSFAQALNKQMGMSTQRHASNGINRANIRDRSMSTEDVVITPRLKNQQIKTSPFPANKNPFKSSKESQQIISLSNINDLRNLKMRLNVESPGRKNNRNQQRVEQIPSNQKTVMYQEYYMSQKEKPQINVVLNKQKKLAYQSPTKAIKVQDTGASQKKNHNDFDPHNDDVISETQNSESSSFKAHNKSDSPQNHMAAVPQSDKKIEMSFQVQQNLQLDELNESQNFHKLKLDQDKLRKINEGLEKNVTESKKIQENLQNKRETILQTEPYELQNESLIRMGDALQQLNADLQAKLQTKIQENFRAELKSIRSLSAKSRTNRSKSFKRRKSLDQATIDDDTSANITVTASAYGTMVSKSNFLQEGRSNMSNMDLSEQDMVEQSKLADKKIELLQKQILLIEQRQKLEKLQIEKDSELTLAIVPLQDPFEDQKRDDLQYKKSSKNNTQKQNSTKNINESFAKAQTNNGTIAQNRDQDEDPYDQSQALKIVDNRKFMNQNSNMESESLQMLAKQYDQDRLDKNLQDLIPNLKLQSGPFNDKNLCIGTSNLDNFGHRKLRESIAEAKKAYVDNSPQQTQSDNINVLSSIPAIEEDLENVGEATLNLNSDLSHLEIQNSVMKSQSGLRMSTNFSNMHYKNMNQDVDLQYVYHVKQLINMLRQQSQMKIYAEQIKVYLENHRNYIKVKQESIKEDRKEVPQPVMGADSIIEGYQMLQKCLITTTQGQSQSSLGSIRQHLKISSTVKPEQITMQIHLVISLLKAIDSQIKKDLNEHRRLLLSVANTSRKPLSRYLKNGQIHGGNYSYQENHLYSRPLSHYENSDIAMSQRGASKHLFVHKLSQNQAKSINNSVKAVDKTNSGHNVMINQGVDIPELDGLSSNSSKDEKITVKRHTQDKEEIKEEIKQQLKEEIRDEKQNEFQRKESTVSKKIDQKYIQPVPELQLKIQDFVPKSKTVQKEDTIQNQSTTSQLTDRARSRLAKANDRLGVRMQKELDKSENKSLNSHRSANYQSRQKHGLQAKSPSSGNIFNRKNNFRSDAVSSRSGKRSHLSISQTRNNQQSAIQANGSGIFMDDKSISAVSNPSAIDGELITFSRFQRMCNSILKEQFKDEPYAQLVSVPAIYKKSSQQLSNNFDPTMNDQDIEKLLKLFIITELKNQIHIYKIQFKQDEKPTPQPDFADKIQDTNFHRKDSLSFSQIKMENLNTPEKKSLQNTDELSSNINRSHREVAHFPYSGTQLTVGLIDNTYSQQVIDQVRDTLTTLKTESATEVEKVYKHKQKEPLIKKNLFNREKSTGSERSFKSSHSRRRRANMNYQRASPMSNKNATINSGQPINGNESETTVKMYYHDLGSDQAYRQQSNNIQAIETNQTIVNSQQRTQEADSPYYNSTIKVANKGHNSPNESSEIIQPKQVQENTVEKESDDEGKDTPRFKDKSSSKIMVTQEDSSYLSHPRKSLLIDDPRDTLNAIKPIPETNSEYNLSSKYSEISNKNKYSLNYGVEKQQ